MFEYLNLLGGNLEGVWTEQVLPLWAHIHSSPYFWPGAVAAGLAMLLITRQVLK